MSVTQIGKAGLIRTREGHGFGSWAAWARAANVPPSTLYRFLAGKRTRPEHVEALAVALDISPIKLHDLRDQTLGIAAWRAK